MDCICSNCNSRSYSNRLRKLRTMILVENETIYIAQGKLLSLCKVLGVYTHCTYLSYGLKRMAIPPFISRGFYGISIEKKTGETTLFLRKWWHYFPAKAAEYIRTIKIFRKKNERVSSNKQ